MDKQANKSENKNKNKSNHGWLIQKSKTSNRDGPTGQSEKATEVLARKYCSMQGKRNGISNCPVQQHALVRFIYAFVSTRPPAAAVFVPFPIFFPNFPVKAPPLKEKRIIL